MDKNIPDTEKTYIFCVSENDEQTRIDHYIAQQFPRYSRSFFKRLLNQECVKLNGKSVQKAGTTLKNQDMVEIIFPGPKKHTPHATAHTVDAQVLYENENFMIINKPAGLIVHQPHPLSNQVTLVDWLLYQHASLKDVGNQERPGIVHRLDKDTSGLMIIPLNNWAHAQFCDMFKNRQIKKTYRALVHGHPAKEGSIDFSIGRDAIHKHKMSHKIGSIAPREALTHFKILNYYENHSLLEAYPITGRTHQIRVHCAAIGHPIVGDPIYATVSKHIKRHALHAYALAFEFDGKEYQFIQEPAPDMQEAISRYSKSTP